MARWKRIILTVLALLGAAIAVLVFVGYGIYQAADVAGNLASIGSFLKALHDAGTVNVGSALLVLFGLFGVGALIMAVWGLGPFRQAKIVQGAQPPSGAAANGGEDHQIEILDGLQEERSYFRVLVRNLTNTTARIGAHLVRLEPMPDGLSLPLPLQITHGDSAPMVAVPAHGAQAIDVFRMFGIKEGVIELQGTNTRLPLTKCAYRFSVRAYMEDGGSAERSFQMRPGLIQASFDAPVDSLSPDGNGYLVDNEVRAAQVDNIPPVVATIANTLATRHGNMNVTAFGILNSIMLHCLNDRTTEPRFRCTVEVAFYGLRPAKPSPTQLRLAAVKNGPELARLDATVGQGCPGIVTYTGEGTWSSLMSAVEGTMASPQWGKREDPSPWRTFPPQQTLLCDLDISVPKGPVGYAHAESNVKLEFELADGVSRIATVQVPPWSTLDPETAISRTNL